MCKIVNISKLNLQDADLLFYRSRGFIATHNRGKHNHVGMVVMVRGQPYIAEMRWFGGRLFPVEKLKTLKWDLYKFNVKHYPTFDRKAAADEMCKLAALPYGRWALIKTAITYVPILCWFMRPNLNDNFNSGTLPHCSDAVSRVMGGVDPVKNLANISTTPSDLARSDCWLYRATVCTK